MDVYGYDPLLSAKEIEGFGVKAITGINGMKLDCVILAVGHEEFKGAGFADVQKAVKECAAVVGMNVIFRALMEWSANEKEGRI